MSDPASAISNTSKATRAINIKTTSKAAIATVCHTFFNIGQLFFYDVRGFLAC